MTATAHYTLTCDECGKAFVGHGDSIQLRQQAESQGWRIAPRYRPSPDYCPDHVGVAPTPEPRDAE